MRRWQDLKFYFAQLCNARRPSLCSYVMDDWCFVVRTRAYSVIDILQPGRHIRTASSTQIARTCLEKLPLQNAASPNGIPARSLRDCAPWLCIALSIICERVLLEGTWPAAWKLHHICMLGKKSSFQIRRVTRGSI